MRLPIALLLLAAAELLNAQGSTTVVLQPSPSPAKLGAAVTLTATITPSTSTGIVTFYDGVGILAVGPISGGSASITTSMLSAGSHTLRAYYGGQSGSAPLTVNAVPAGGFQPVASYSAGASPLAAAAGDFNSDGKADLAVVDDSGAVTILVGKGDGTFESGASYPVPQPAYALAVGDFNNDGKPDLAVSTAGTAQPSQITIFLGNGDGTFNQSPTVLPLGTAGYSLAVIDANGDGNADLAVPSEGGMIFLGNGDGTFQPPDYVGDAGGATIVAADFNNDGKVDLATAADGAVVIVLGNGDGSFQPGVAFPVGTGMNAGALAVADFNGDGYADLVVSLVPSGVSVLLGNGNGTFQSPILSSSSIGSPYYAGSLVAGDFNGDGKMDIAISNSSDIDGVTVAAGNGDGTFQAPLFYRVGSNNISGIVAGDFNGDGRTDLAAASSADNAVGILLGQAAANPTVTAVSVSPSFGTGNSQTFVFQFSDSAGANDIATVSAVFGQETSPGLPICAVTYNKVHNTIALWNDDGTVPAGAAPGGGTQQNSFCSLDGTMSGVSASGNSLTLTLAITFKIEGADEWGEAVSVTGSTSGLQLLGTWLSDPPPQVLGVTPSSGTGTAATLSFVYAGPATFGQLSLVEAIVQSPRAGVACDVTVNPVPGTLTLSGATGQLTLGSTGTLQNSECTVDSGASSGVPSGGTYTLTLALAFTSVLSGRDSLIGRAVNQVDLDTGLQTLGTWSIYPPCSGAPGSAANVSDVQGIINEALGTMPLVGDMNLDGAINVVDVQIVLNSALNLGCSQP
jgi:large repetitive protein